MPLTTPTVLAPPSSSTIASISSARRTRRVAAWFAGALVIACAAIGALSLEGPTASSSPGEPAVVALVDPAEAAGAAADARQARLAAMRARVAVLQARVEALPAKPPAVTPATVKPPVRPARPVKPPVVSDDDGGHGPIAIDPACLANPLCTQR